MEELTLYISEEVFTEFLAILLTYGIGGAFAITTLLILITFAVFKALSLLSDKK